MIITRTPVRISFLGGGTDYAEHYRLHRGQTLGVSINKYSYLTVNEHEDLSDYSIRVSYSRVELCQSSSRSPESTTCRTGASALSKGVFTVFEPGCEMAKPVQLRVMTGRLAR